MLAYVSNRPAAAKRQSSPHAMLFIVSAHVALLAVVMSAKMDLPARFQKGPSLIRIMPLPPPPPPHRAPSATAKSQQLNRIIDKTTPRIESPLPILSPPEADPSSPDQMAGAGGGGVVTIPAVPQQAATAPVRHGPRLLTPPSELKPPYPASKLASEEEAQLRLRLTIDDRGRVIGVDPLGYADREFLDTARRYILTHWRFDPGTQDGRAVATTTVVTLWFKLDS